MDEHVYGCRGGRDGECNWRHCPQLRDGEPSKSHRHCPLDDAMDDLPTTRLAAVAVLGKEVVRVIETHPPHGELKPLTDAQRKMLTILANHQSLIGPQALGSEMWPVRYRGSNCSAPFARPAGKILNALRARGLAEWICDEAFWGWRITSEGKIVLAEADMSRGMDSPQR